MQTFVDITGLWILLIAATGIYLAWPKEGEEDSDGYELLGFILITSDKQLCPVQT
jgi:hypothetical protein